MTLEPQRQKPVRNFNIRNRVIEIEKALMDMPGRIMGKNFPLKHSFADGMYVREIFVPKNYLVVTKIHKHSHPCFVLKGKCIVLSEEGVKIITAPFSMITPAGTKRVVYVLEDTIWATVHKTYETDLDEIEKEVIASSFDEIDNIIDIKKEDIKLFIDTVSERII